MEGKLYEQIYGYFSKKSDLNEALEAYKKVVSEYPDSPAAPDALYKEAKVYEVRLGDKEKAKELYHEIITKYPKSTANQQVKDNLKICKANNMDKGEVKKEVQTTPPENDKDGSKGNQASSSHEDMNVSQEKSSTV